MNPDKLKNIVKFYQEPGFVYPESRNMQLAKRFLQFGSQEFYDEVGSGITGDEPNVVDILREEGISVPNVTKPAYNKGGLATPKRGLVDGPGSYSQSTLSNSARIRKYLESVDGKIDMKDLKKWSKNQDPPITWGKSSHLYKILQEPELKDKIIYDKSQIFNPKDPESVEIAMKKITEVMDNPDKFPLKKDLKEHLGFHRDKGVATVGISDDPVDAALKLWTEKTGRTIPENRWGKFYKLDGTKTGQAIIESYIDSLDSPEPKGMQELASDFGLKGKPENARKAISNLLEKHGLREKKMGGTKALRFKKQMFKDLDILFKENPMATIDDVVGIAFPKLDKNMITEDIRESVVDRFLKDYSSVQRTGSYQTRHGTRIPINAETKLDEKGLSNLDNMVRKHGVYRVADSIADYGARTGDQSAINLAKEWNAFQRKSQQKLRITLPGGKRGKFTENIIGSHDVSRKLSQYLGQWDNDVFKFTPSTNAHNKFRIKHENNLTRLVKRLDRVLKGVETGNIDKIKKSIEEVRANYFSLSGEKLPEIRVSPEGKISAVSVENVTDFRKVPANQLQTAFFESGKRGAKFTETIMKNYRGGAGNPKDWGTFTQYLKENVEPEKVNPLKLSVEKFQERTLNYLKLKKDEPLYKELMKFCPNAKKVGGPVGSCSLEDASKGLQQEINKAKGTGNFKKISKIGRVGGAFFGWVDAPIEFTFALPGLLRGDTNEALRNTTLGLFGAGGTEFEQLEEGTAEYKYAKDLKDVQQYVKNFSEANKLKKYLDKTEEFSGNPKVDAQRKYYKERFDTVIKNTKNIADQYKPATLAEKVQARKELRNRQIAEAEEGLTITDVPFVGDVKIAPYGKPKDLSEIDTFIEYKGDPFYGAYKTADEELGIDPSLQNTFYEKDIRDRYTDLPIELASQLGSFEKRETDELEKQRKEKGILRMSNIPFAEYFPSMVRGAPKFIGFAGGGIADVRRPSAIAPESGPTPQGEGLSYLFNRVTDL